jgi:hypothetical protein
MRDAQMGKEEPYMKRHATSVALLYIAVLTTGAALVGCERQNAAPATGQTAPSAAAAAGYGKEAVADSVSARGATTAAVQGTGTKDTMHISSESQTSPAAPSTPAAEVTATLTTSKPAGNSDTDKKPDSPKPKVDAKDAYQEEKPTLLGLSLHTPKDDVLAKLGPAKNKFVMDDDTDPVTVYEYADFSVGFNKSDALEFVDIRSADIDPGLHGLRLGQKAEDAVKALGKPDTNSSFVLTYKSQGTFLKLDLDPKEGTIRSIKLFNSK